MSKQKGHSVTFLRSDTAQSKELKEQSVIATSNDYATAEGNARAQIEKGMSHLAQNKNTKS